jgi:hypothetical protein
MATLEATHTGHFHVLEGSGSIVEAVGGVGTAALAIIGIAGVLPQELAAIASIAVGAALLAEGGTVAARFARLLQRAGGVELGRDLGGGVSASLLGGLAGIVLGILALVGVVPTVLMPAAIVVFGAAILVSSTATWRVGVLAASSTASPEIRAVAEESLKAASGAQLMVGVASVTLGILAIVGIHPVLLGLVALLSLGVSIVLEGTTLGGAMMAALAR